MEKFVKIDTQRKLFGEIGKEYRILYDDSIPGYYINKNVFDDEQDMWNAIDSFYDGDENDVCVTESGEMFAVYFKWRDMERVPAIWQRCVEVEEND